MPINSLENALQLTLGDKTLTFNSLDEFEFALSGRTEVPWERLARSFQLSGEELKREATGIKRVEKQFVEILSKTMEDHTTIGKHFGGMDTKIFSNDHQWRDIVDALNAQGPEYDEFKRLALVKYMQYLTSRQEVVQSIYTRRKRVGNGAIAGPDAQSDQSMKETVVFDLTQTQMAPIEKEEQMGRLPKGEPVEVPLLPGEEITILLSKHRFRLQPGNEYHLIDDSGGDYILSSGHNFVGRETDCEIMVNHGYRDVSRKHLLIDLSEPGIARLTDFSSHGSSIAEQYLDRTDNHKG